MSDFAATAVLTPAGARIEWSPHHQGHTTEATIVGFIDELRLVAGRTPSGEARALVRNMAKDVTYHDGDVTILAVDAVGSTVCTPASPEAWQAATSPEPQLPLSTTSPRGDWSPRTPHSPAPESIETPPATWSAVTPPPGTATSPTAPVLPGAATRTTAPAAGGGIESLFAGQSFASTQQETISLPEITVATANTKGGASKTTLAILVVQAAADMAGHNDVALVDINPSGNLGEHTHRSAPGNIIDLARASKQPGFARSPKDLAPFISWQPGGWITVNCPSSIVSNDGGLITDLDHTDIASVTQALRNQCRMLVYDTGNNAKDPAWQAAVGTSHRILIPLQWDPDTVVEAQKMITDMHALGHPALKERVIFVGTHAPSAKPDRKRARTYRAALVDAGWKVMDIPPDRHIAAKGIIDWTKLNPKTRTAASNLVREILSR